uniref:transposase n=27 Tax=Thiolapillus sp. TaxID=2017437 RepID=UPI003AF8985C
DDPLHGQQEGRFFHGYYRCYCYLPLYIFSGEHLLCARLRTADKDASSGSVDELQRIVGQIRARWPKTRIIIRADAGFCRDAIMAWCETNDVGYVLGLARNKRLQQALGKEMEEARLACERTGEAARCFRDFRYRTRKSWSCERRVIGKAEYLPGKANPRFVVTNLSTLDADAQHLYEDLYCARGEMEKFIGNEFSRKPRRGEAQGCAEQNRIKEQQLGLFADRTSSATLRANQLRLYFSSFAYVLLHGLRRLGLTGTAFAKAQSTTIRLKLLKIGARLRLTARKVWLSFSEAYPYASDIAQILANLKQHPAWSPPG